MKMIQEGEINDAKTIVALFFAEKYLLTCLSITHLIFTSGLKYRMARILIVGCGDLGTAIALHLHQSQHEVIGLRISPRKLPNGIQTIQADVTKLNTLSLINQFKSTNYYLLCCRQRADCGRKLSGALCAGFKNVLATQTKNTHLQHVFFVSSTRVYGQATQGFLMKM